MYIGYFDLGKLDLIDYRSDAGTGGRGGTAPPPNVLADQLTLFQPSTLYYWHPQIFSPSGITEYRS